MKKLLSVLLCAAMLMSAMVFTANAANQVIAAPVDQVLMFDDLKLDNCGSCGYAANTEDYTKDVEGMTLAFDFNAIEGVPCAHQFDKPNYKHLSAMNIILGGEDGMKSFVYDFETQSFGLYYIGWPPSGHNFVDGINKKYVEAPFECKPGEWHRVVINIWDIDVTVYVDGEEIMSYSFLGGDYGSLSHDYILWYSQHARFAIDNVVVASPDPDEYDPTNEDYNADSVFCFENFDYATPLTNIEVVEEEQIDEKTGNVVLDDEGNPKMVTNYYFNGEELGKIKLGDTPFFGGMSMGKIATGDGTLYVPAYSILPKDSVVSVTEADEADISFADVGGKRNSDITVAVTAGANPDGTYTFAADEYITLKEVKNVAAGAAVTVDGNTVTISGASAGKLCDFVLTTSALCKQDDSYRYGFLPVEGKALDGGKVTVVNFKYGDCNEDGSINNKDVAAMLKAKAGWDTTKFAWNAEAADVYSDGTFTSRDIQHLIRHLAGYGGVYKYIPSSSAPADA